MCSPASIATCSMTSVSTNTIRLKSTLALLFILKASLVSSLVTHSFVSGDKQWHRTSSKGRSSISMYVESKYVAESTRSVNNELSKKGPALYVPQKRKPSLDTTKVGTLTVPRVGTGTISWSTDSPSSLEGMELQSVVSRAYESGIFLDTAERYGSNLKTALGLGWGETEVLTRKLLDRAAVSTPNTPIVKPVVATKFTPSPWRTTAQSVVDACEESRKRLQVNTIDLYQLHMPDIVQPLRFLGMDTPKDEAYWDGLAECYHRGLVANVGVCNYGPTLLTRCQEALAKRGVPLASNQIAYSLLGRQNGSQETLDKCKELGIEVLAFFPFAMGLLTGKYSSQSIETMSEDVITSLTTSKKTKLEIQDLKKYAMGDGKTIPEGGISPLLAVMETIAKKRKKTVAQVALNYIICKGAIPIPGARTAAQIEDNMGAMGWRLARTEIAMLEFEADQLGFGFEGAGFKRTSEKFVGYGVEKWTLD